MPIAVSVVIPTYNRPHFLEKALHSVCAQTFSDFEVIVVDDGTLSVAGVVASIADPRVRLVRNNGLHGAGHARNIGIREAQGAFIAFLDDDDTWRPEKLSKQYERLTRANATVGYSFTAVTVQYDDWVDTTVVPEGEGDYKERAYRRFSGTLTSTLLIRKSVFEKVGDFDAQLPSHQEAELMIRVASAFRGVGINEPLVSMYAGSQHEHIGRNLTRRIEGRELLLQKHADLFESKPSLLSFHLFVLGVWYRDLGHYRKAQSIFWKAFHLSPAPLSLFHALSLVGDGMLYRFFRPSVAMVGSAN